jgi:hypothetical protein
VGCIEEPSTLTTVAIVSQKAYPTGIQRSMPRIIISFSSALLSKSTCVAVLCAPCLGFLVWQCSPIPAIHSPVFGCNMRVARTCHLTKHCTTVLQCGWPASQHSAKGARCRCHALRSDSRDTLAASSLDAHRPGRHARQRRMPVIAAAMGEAQSVLT